MFFHYIIAFQNISGKLQLSENDHYLSLLCETGDYFKTFVIIIRKKLDYINDAAILYWPLAHGAILQMTALTEPIRRAIF